MNFADLLTKCEAAQETQAVQVIEETVKAPIEVPFSVRAKAKIEEEYASLKTRDKYSKVVAEYVKNIVLGFIDQNETFGEIVLYTKRTMSDILFEVFKGFNGNHLSDIDTYRMVVRNYCPDADINMIMTVEVPAVPDTEVLTRSTEYPVEKKIEAPKYEPPKAKTPEEIEAEKAAAEQKKKEDELRKAKEKQEKAHPGQLMFFDLLGGNND